MLSDSQFRSEVENNILDITSHTSARRTDLITHAYPCGVTSDGLENILRTNANWNFLSARGYHINDFEDQTPSNFFELKSFNTPHYHDPPLNPPDYLQVIDQTESQGKWANLVFHNECTDDGAINYLPTKNLWVDTIGNVIKYIKLRDNALIINLIQNESEIRFTVNTPSAYQSAIYNQEITLKITMPSNKRASSVLINNQQSQYQLFNSQQNIILINVPFPINEDVVIRMQ